MEHAPEMSRKPEGRRPRRPGDRAPETDSPNHPLLGLQQTAGNRAMQQLLGSGAIKAKHSISRPGDPAEQEADAMADHIMRSHAGAEATGCTCGTEEGEMCDECRQKAGLMRKASAGGDAGRSGSGSRVLNAIRRSPGHPLDAATRAFFEPRFGRDFSDVRIHTDDSAAASARSIHAHAYAAGEHLVFDTGKFAPETESGRRLLAHELAHVAQERNGTPAIHRQSDASLQITMTPEYARGLSSDELAREEAAVAEYLDDMDGDDPEWDAVAENLKVLRNEKDRRAKEAAGAAQTSSIQALQVQVLTAEQYMAMTGMSPDQLPEGQYISAAVTGTATGMMTSGLYGLSSAGISAGANVSGGPATAGPIDMSSPAGRVVAFGRTGPYMDVAETNTGLGAVNIQDANTYLRSLRLGRGLPPGMPYFPGGAEMESVFENPAQAGGLDPMFSGIMTQEALEGDVAGTLHFDMRDVDLTPPLPEGEQPGISLQDFHSSSEARQAIAYLASTNPGERNVTIFIQHEDGVTVITPDSNTVQGAPLPERLASRVPNINNTPEVATGIAEGIETEGLVATGLRSLPKGAGFIRAGGTILMIYGAFQSYKRIEEASPEERPIVEAEEAGSWTGGIIGNIVGSAIGGAAVCAETGPGAFFCALAFGIAGGITGSVIGKDLAHDLAEGLRMSPAEFARAATLMFGTPEEKRSMCELKHIEDPDNDIYDPLCDGL
jgi:hypothetical protein